MLTKTDKPQQTDQCQQPFLDLLEDMRKTRASFNRDRRLLWFLGGDHDRAVFLFQTCKRRITGMQYIA